MEMTREEWWDVYREMRPEATRDEFDADWEDFQRIKKKREQEKAVQ